jgi:hypothetical protein
MLLLSAVIIAVITVLHIVLHTASPTIRPEQRHNRCTGALSIRQPWASLIVLGIKKVENCAWPTKHRGRLWIHATRREGKSWNDYRDLLPKDSDVPAWDELPAGSILGSVELYDCLDEFALPQEMQLHHPFVSGPWCWLLRDPQPLARPWPCKGALRLWDVPAGFKTR